MGRVGSDGRLGVVAAVAAIIAHARSVWFGFTGLDDRDLIVDDHAFLARPQNLVHAFGRSYMHVVDPGHAYYRPIVTLSYGLDALWSGLHPSGYHATNVALHAVATSLVCALLRRFAMPPAVALAGALVFAVHPVLAAAVAWIPGRNDSLLAIFAFAAWLFLLRDRSTPSRVDRALHFAFFALGLLTKETAIALPAVWLFQPLFVDRARGWTRTDLGYVAGWTALTVARIFAHDAFAGAPSTIDAGALAQSVPLFGACLGTLVVPFAPTAIAVASDLSPWLGVATIIGLVVGAKFIPGVRARIVGFGAFAFATLLAPTFAVGGALVQGSRLYLPAFGVVLALGELVRARMERSSSSRHDARVFAALLAVVIIVLAVVTSGYEGSFREGNAFAREAVAGSPHSPLAHFCLGQSYQADGNADRALAEYQISLALGPGEVVHNNIAVIYMASARWDDAERELREELKIDPRYARAYANLALVLRRQGREREAVESAATARALETK